MSKKHDGYVLLNVLIVVALMTSGLLMIYQQYSQQKQSLTLLKNELTAKAMLNLQGDVSHSQQTFNVGTIKQENSKSVVRLDNGYTYISVHNSNP